MEILTYGTEFVLALAALIWLTERENGEIGDNAIGAFLIVLFAITIVLFVMLNVAIFNQGN